MRGERQDSCVDIGVRDESIRSFGPTKFCGRRGNAEASCPVTIDVVHLPRICDHIIQFVLVAVPHGIQQIMAVAHHPQGFVRF